MSPETRISGHEWPEALCFHRHLLQGANPGELDWFCGYLPLGSVQCIPNSCSVVSTCWPLIMSSRYPGLSHSSSSLWKVTTLFLASNLLMWTSVIIPSCFSYLQKVVISYFDQVKIKWNAEMKTIDWRQNELAEEKYKGKGQEINFKFQEKSPETRIWKSFRITI